MSRLLGAGEEIAMLTNEAGAPTGFEWMGVAHRVEIISEQWRVDVGWWRWRAWREYYLLATDRGMLVMLYHDLSADRWFLQRIYD